MSGRVPRGAHGSSTYGGRRRAKHGRSKARARPRASPLLHGVQKKGASCKAYAKGVWAAAQEKEQGGVP